jgi:cellulose synthase/poly-beta-1,6-N-acetylglucosamine synthase-like glycosyltransferase
MSTGPARCAFNGLEATQSEVLCFLDADDALAKDYLELGLAEFTEYRVGVVYSDVLRIPGDGERSRCLSPWPAAGRTGLA